MWLLLLLNSTTYVVNEAEQVIVTQFGEPVGKPVLTPGLHFKVPLIQRANYFDKRFLEWDGDPNQVPTKDKRFIWVDSYARWRISDPLKFFQRLRDERGAQSRLDDIVDGETRSAVARHDLVEVVRSSNREGSAGETGSEEETLLEQDPDRSAGDNGRDPQARFRPCGGPRDPVDGFPPQADQLCRRSPEGRLCPHDRRTQPGGSALPFRRRGRSGTHPRRARTRSAERSSRKPIGPPRESGARRMPRRPTSTPRHTTGMRTSMPSPRAWRPTS